MQKKFYCFYNLVQSEFRDRYAFIYCTVLLFI